MRLGVSQYRSSYFLPLVLPRFRSLFPAIDITLVEATNDALETCAADGTTDVSIVLAPVLNNELTYTALYDEKILIATAADSALAKSVPETKAEFDKLDFSRLDAEPFITLRRGQKFHRLFWNLSSRCSVSPRIVLESESPIAALMLASAGLAAPPLSPCAFLKLRRSFPRVRSSRPGARTPISAKPPKVSLM